MIKKLLQAYDRAKELSGSADGRVFIRGAGTYGRQLYRELTSLGIRVSALLDANCEKFSKSNYPVVAPDEVYKYKRGSVIIFSAFKDDAVYEAVKSEWLEHGLIEGEDFVDFGIKADERMQDEYIHFMDVLPVSFDRRMLTRMVAESLGRETQKLIPGFDMNVDTDSDTVFIASLDFPITTFCSLRCKYCSHAIPHVKKPRHFEPERIVSDLDKLLSVCKVGSLHLMGGEALVHPQLIETVRLLSNMSNIRNLSVVRLLTNATAVPSDEVMREFARLDNGFFLINDYGKASRAVNAIEEKCREFSVPHITNPPSNTWTDLGTFEQARGYNESELRQLFALCYTAMCTRLHDGKLYLCTRHAALNEEKLIPYDETSFIDVRNTSTELLCEKLAGFYYDTKFVSACRYCDGAYPDAKKVISGT